MTKAQVEQDIEYLKTQVGSLIEAVALHQEILEQDGDGFDGLEEDITKLEKKFNEADARVAFTLILAAAVAEKHGERIKKVEENNEYLLGAGNSLLDSMKILLERIEALEKKTDPRLFASPRY